MELFWSGGVANVFFLFDPAFPAPTNDNVFEALRAQARDPDSDV